MGIVFDYLSPFKRQIIPTRFNLCYHYLMHLLSLADSVRLRREYFGGIAFDASTGTTVDVDKAAFNMLSTISINSAVPQEDLIKTLRSTGLVSGKNSKAATKVIKRFLELGILRIKPYAVDGNDYSQTVGNNERLLKIPESTKGWRFENYLSAPETVHWAITFRCASNCPDCYAKRHLGLFSCEMDTRDALRAVDTISEWGVFQLAIGGGEPFLRSDLVDITARASQNGLAVHITTGYDNLDLAIFQKLSRNIKCLQIGVKHDRLMAQPQQTETAMLKRIVEASTGVGIQTGANLILSKSSIKNFELLLDSLVQAGITRITLLRYKPPKDILRWKQENPSVEMMAEFETRLSNVVAGYSDIEFRLDCALSFLQRRLSFFSALASGIRGCVAADRIIALMPDGSVYPCSQLVHPGFSTGNILTDDIEELWTQDRSLKNYRFFKSKGWFKKTKCSVCLAKDHCGGCRVFSHNGESDDPGCPKPILPQTNQLGKNGRKFDLRKHCDKYGGISVGKYMERYGVGQERAVKELKNTNWLRLDCRRPNYLAHVRPN